MLWKCQEKNLFHQVGLLSKAVCISCIIDIDSNWAKHESPGRKPYWEGVKNLLLSKWLNRESYVTLANILLKIESKLIGRVCLLFFVQELH